MSATLEDLARAGFTDLVGAAEELTQAQIGHVKILSETAVLLASDYAAGRITAAQYESAKEDLLLAARSRLAQAGVEARQKAVEVATGTILAILRTAALALA